MQNFFFRLAAPLIAPINVPDLEAVLWYSRHFFCTFSAHISRLNVHSVFDSLWVLCWSYWPTSATEKLWKLRSLRTRRGDHTIYGLSTSLFLCPHSQNLDIGLLLLGYYLLFFVCNSFSFFTTSNVTPFHISLSLSTLSEFRYWTPHMGPEEKEPNIPF